MPSLSSGLYQLTLFQAEVTAPVPLVICHFLPKPPAVWSLLKRPCHLVSIEGVDEAALLPYPCPQLGPRFTEGNALSYYATLTDTILPTIRERLGPQTISELILAGYSLAGLFALFAAIQAHCPFSRFISCSGSLWYPGVLDAIKLPPEVAVPRSIYLSLGSKEKSKGPKMFRAVERCTKEAHAYYENYCHCVFELNNGGHFDQVNERMARGINWTCDQIALDTTA